MGEEEEEEEEPGGYLMGWVGVEALLQYLSSTIEARHARD